MNIYRRYFVKQRVVAASENIVPPLLRSDQRRDIVWVSSEFSKGQPWRNGELLLRVRLSRPYKSLPHIGHLGPGVFWASTHARAAIEALEPNAHQFIRIDLRDKEDREWPEPFYLLNVCNRLNAIIPESSGIISRERHDGSAYLTFGGGRADDMLTVAGEVVGCKAMWRDEVRTSHDVYISDKLRRRFDELGVRSLEYARVLVA